MTSANELRDRVSLWGEGPPVDNGWGEMIPGPFEEQGIEHAHVRYLRGGETVMAGRLTGKQPAIFTLRQNVLTRAMTTAWVIKTEDGAAFNVRAINDPDGKNAWLEMLGEKGVAT